MHIKIHKSGEIEDWYEGLPLGNGEMGGLLYGGDSLTLALDKAGLWDTRMPPEMQEEGFQYSHFVELIKSGDEKSWSEMARLFDGCYNHTTPTKINAGKLFLDFCMENSVHSLDLKTATATLENGENKICAWIAAKSNLGYLLSNKPLSYCVEFPEYFYRPYTNEKSDNSGLGYEKSTFVEKKGVAYYLQKTAQDGVFAIAVSQRKTKEGYLLSYSVIVGDNEQEILQKGKEIFTIDWQEDYKAHIAYWKNYWKQSSISIPDKKLEKLYYKSYYLFASGNRQGSYPMPLQGIWTDCSGQLPPWKGDYHHDLNTQFTYMSYLKANHVEEGQVFVEYLWSLKKTYEKIAKDFYGVDGLLVPAVSTADGKPLGGWPIYSLSPTMSIWLAQSFDEYYQYTQDEDFLREKAYPFFDGVMTAIVNLLEERGGKLYLPVSSSPEYNDFTPQAVYEWSNNDLQLVRYGLEVICAYCDKLGEDKARYAEVKNRLDDFYTDNNGVLLLDEKNYVLRTHRHHSNLMCIYPLKTLTAQNGANIRQIENNLINLEGMGTGHWVGFSFPWFAGLSAMGYFGNRAYYYLQIFERCFVSETGFHLNGDYKKFGVTVYHYRPFTLEANYCFCDALQEMLVQNHEGFLHLFPAIPEEWTDKRISFNDFLCEGCLVSAKLEKGKIVSFEIRSDKSRTIKIKNTFGREKLVFSDGQTVLCKKGELFVLRVGKEKYTWRS